MVEELGIWRHQYRGFWPDERIRAFAINAWCHCYRQWVIFKGWRKPPNWVEGQRVPLRLLWPKDKPFTPDRFAKWRRRMSEKYAKGGDEDA